MDLTDTKSVGYMFEGSRDVTPALSVENRQSDALRNNPFSS
jgi:hypothetical protein